MECCEELLVCKEEDNKKATVNCEDCGSRQCDACCERIHDLSSGVRTHNIIRLAPAVQPCKGFCNKANPPEKYCMECRTQLCTSCDSQLHSKGKKAGHVRKTLDDVMEDNSALSRQPSRMAEELRDGYEAIPNEAIAETPSGHSISKDGEIPARTAFCQNDNDDDSPPRKRSGETQPAMDEKRDCRSFLLMDGHEELKIKSVREFSQHLSCRENKPVKVVSIVGNTGDGKSHALNKAFFDGEEVFSTSPHQSSCTVGVWCAYDRTSNAVILDTEGKLGVRKNVDSHTRLLLKILAISDVVIYRTRAERLHRDMYQFLSTSSESYQKYFAAQLKATADKLEVDLPCLGPALVIFHTTQYTQPLGLPADVTSSKARARDSMAGSRRSSKAEEFLRQEFRRSCDSDPKSFCSITYEGYKMDADEEGDVKSFEMLNRRVRKLLRDTKVRSPRNLAVIFKSLQDLNSKFSGEILKKDSWLFPDQYFTCQAKCQSCGNRCLETMNHQKENIPHKADPKSLCSYQHEFENKIYLCKQCSDAGRRNVVMPKTGSSKDTQWLGLVKFAWSGYILECRKCAVIYRSRQQWYGNRTPEEAGAVVTEIQHVWPGETPVNATTENAARLVLDGVASAASRISTVASPTTAALSDWVQDKLAPSYWIPNAKLTKCYGCKQKFGSNESKHHCRQCGQGFCDDCSKNRIAVPWRGWGDEPVRVCNECHETIQGAGDDGVDALAAVASGDDSNNVLPRRVTEVVRSAYGAVANVMQYPKKGLVDSARPQYWIPDEELTNCSQCKRPFGGKVSLHHCRACGKGVCGECSPYERPVPSRGWDHPTRVCKECNEKKDPL
eukprot:m.70056 g.70056  ORF g.70056 m.70056 type:complete len:839 (+) comp35656_c0_seq1:22-2538(+)